MAGGARGRAAGRGGVPADGLGGAVRHEDALPGAARPLRRPHARVPQPQRGGSVPPLLHYAHDTLHITTILYIAFYANLTTKFRAEVAEMGRSLRFLTIVIDNVKTFDRI